MIRRRLSPILCFIGIFIFISLGCNFLSGASRTEIPADTDLPINTPENEVIPVESATVTPTIEINATSASLTLSITSFLAGDEIQVSFTAPANFQNDAWIGIIPSNVAHGSEVEGDNNDIDYQHLEGNNSGILTFLAPETPGLYDFRMYDTDSNGSEYASVTFTVEGSAGFPGMPFSCGGISLSYDESIAVNVYCESLPGSSQMEIYPDYNQVTFDGYILQNTLHSPRIMIYPVQEYEAMDQNVVNRISDLQQILAQEPATADSMPFLPMWNAGQMMNSNIDYLDFQNGRGVRYLTQYGQAFYPVNNDSLFYTFQGITNDGLYYISAVLPVSNPLLPADETIQGDMDAFYNNFDSYIADMEGQLNSWANSSFTPDLTLLDQMFQSLSVQ
jgi:hypothetical protein